MAAPICFAISPSTNGPLRRKKRSSVIKFPVKLRATYHGPAPVANFAEMRFARDRLENSVHEDISIRERRDLPASNDFRNFRLCCLIVFVDREPARFGGFQLALRFGALLGDGGG